MSTVNSYEYASLVGHFNTYNKDSSELKQKERGYSPAMRKYIKQVKRGSQGYTSLNLKFEHDDKVTCKHFNFLYTLFHTYDTHGNLPYDGPVTKQPAKIMEYFSILSQLKFESEQKQQQDAKKEMNKKNGRR